MQRNSSRLRWRWGYGFVGFLGFIGLLIGNYSLCNAFMPFFIFTRKGNRTDERWERSVFRACKLTLFFMLAIPCFVLATFGPLDLFPVGLFPLLTALLLLIGTSVFVLSYAYFNRRGD